MPTSAEKEIIQNDGNFEIPDYNPKKYRYFYTRDVPPTVEEVNIKLEELSPEKQKKIRQSYQQVLEKVFAEKMHEIMKGVVIELRSGTDFLASENIEDELLRGYVENIEATKELPYDDARKIYEALHNHLESAKKKCNYQSELNVLNASLKSFEGLKIVAKYNIPAYVDGLNQITTLREQTHVVKRKKKSFFRRALEFIFPKLKKDDQETLIVSSKELGSTQKAAAKFLGEKVLDKKTKDSSGHLEQLKADIEFMNDPNRLKIPITTPAETLAKTKVVTKKDKAGIAARVLAKGALGFIESKVSGYSAMDYMLSYIREIPENDERDLGDHLKETFNFEAKCMAFNSMMSLTSDLYGISEMLHRFESNHGHAIDIDDTLYEKLGCAHINTPEFKRTMISMAKALGFEVDADQPIHKIIYKLYYASDEDKRAALKRFIEGEESGVGFAALNEIMSNEQKRILDSSVHNKKSSSHYNALIDSHYSILKKINSKARKDNLIVEGLKLSGVDESYFNAEATGFVAGMTNQARSEIIAKIPSVVQSLLHEPNQLMHNAQVMNKNYLDGVRDTLSKMIEEASYNDRNVTQNTRSTSMSSEASWSLAGEQARRMLENQEVKKLTKTDPFAKYAGEKWQQEAAKVILNVIKLCDQEQIQRIETQLREELQQLEASQAHPKIIANKRKQIEAFTPDNIRRQSEMSLDEFQYLYDAVYAGVSGMQKSGKFKDVQDRGDFFMMYNALSCLKSAKVIPEVAARLKTAWTQGVEEASYSEPGFMEKFLYKKGQGLWQDYWAGTAYRQLEYYTQKRSEGHHLYTESTVKPPVDDSWATYIGTMASSVTRYAFDTSVASGQVIATAAYNRVFAQDYESGEKLSQAIVDAATITIREQTFDATYNMATQLYGIKIMMDRAAKDNLQPGTDPYAELGFVNKEHFESFLQKVSEALGFINPGEMYNAAPIDGNAKQNEFYNKVKDRFCKIPKTSEEQALDPFVTLKTTIYNENETLTKRLNKKGYKNAQNYVMMISSLTNLIYQVELCQRETIAADLISPEIERKLGINGKNKSLWQHLKSAAYLRAGGAAARQGMLSQLQTNISMNDQMTMELTKACQDSLTRLIERETLEKNRGLRHGLENLPLNELRELLAREPLIANGLVNQVVLSSLKSANNDRINTIMHAMSDKAFNDFAVNILYSHKNSDNTLIASAILAHSDMSEDNPNFSDLKKMVFDSKFDHDQILILLNAHILGEPVSSDMHQSILNKCLKDLDPKKLSDEFVSEILQHFLHERAYSQLSRVENEVFNICLAQSVSRALNKPQISEVQRGYTQMFLDNDMRLLTPMRNFFLGLKQEQTNVIKNLHTFESESYWPIQNLLIEYDAEDISEDKLNAYEAQLASFESKINELEAYSVRLNKLQDQWIETNANIKNFDNPARRQNHIDQWKNEVSLDDTIKTMKQRLKESRDQISEIRQEKRELDQTASSDVSTPSSSKKNRAILSAKSREDSKASNSLAALTKDASQIGDSQEVTPSVTPASTETPRIKRK